jgi:hypothetical protein
MSKPSVYAITIVVVFVATAFSMSRAQSNPVPDLPSGEMQAKARTSCMECHDARIILQQRLNMATWTKEVDKMIKWGAVVDPKDRDALIDYLSINFPPDKPPEPLARVGR